MRYPYRYRDMERLRLDPHYINQVGESDEWDTDRQSPHPMRDNATHSDTYSQLPFA